LALRIGQNWLLSVGKNWLLSIGKNWFKNRRKIGWKKLAEKRKIVVKSQVMR